MLEHRQLSVGVGKGQVLQLNVPVQVQGGIRRCLGGDIHDIRLFPENAGDPLEGSRGLAENIDAIAAGNHRPDQHADISIEGYKLTDSDLAGQNHFSAEGQSQQQA